MHVPFEEAFSHEALETVLTVREKGPRPPVLALFVHPESEIAQNSVTLGIFDIL